MFWKKIFSGFFVFFLVFLIGSCAAGETYSLDVRVLDNGEPLEEVIVNVAGDKYFQGKTGEDGSLEIEGKGTMVIRPFRGGIFSPQPGFQ